MEYNICFVLGNYFKYCKGGAELQAYYIAREFHKRGWKVHYVFIVDSIHNTDLSTEDDDGIILHKLKKRELWRRIGKYFFMDYFKLQKALKNIEPDIIYQRGGSAYTGICAKYAAKFDKKFIWAVASTIDCIKNRSNICFLNLVGGIINTLDNFFAEYGIRRADRIITQANYQTSLLKENFGLKSITIPNSHYIPDNQIIKDSPPIIAWISNIKQLKRPDLFIELAKACQDLETHFILAGRPKDEKYQNILLLNLKETPNAEYIGEISLEESNQLLSRASIFVNTSNYEGFPNTFIQAWLQKTPVVSLNVDPDDVLKKEKIGLHSESFEQLVKDVRFLIQEEKKRMQLGEKARKYAEKKFDVHKNILKLEEVCLELLVGK